MEFSGSAVLVGDTGVMMGHGSHGEENSGTLQLARFPIHFRVIRVLRVPIRMVVLIS